MTKTLRTLALIAVAIFTTISLSAQDLSSQRGESQSLGNMLGERIDHKGLVINPTPKHIATLPFNGEEYGKITDFNQYVNTDAYRTVSTPEELASALFDAKIYGFF